MLPLDTCAPGDGRYYVERHELDPKARRVIRTLERELAALPGWAGRGSTPRHTESSAESLRQDDLVRAVARAERTAAVPEDTTTSASNCITRARAFAPCRRSPR